METADTAWPRLPELRRRQDRRLLAALAMLSILLLSFSGVLFSASLWIGKGLESPGRADHALLIRAEDRLRYFFPLQLMAIAIVDLILVSRIPVDDARTKSSVVLQKSLLLSFGFLVLLLLDYIGGIVLFDRWGLIVVQWLKSF